MDADHLRNLPASINPALAWHACAAAMAQAGDELAAQLAPGLRVNGRVDRLVRYMHAGVLGPHSLKDTGDLLRRPLPIQQSQHRAPPSVLRIELRYRARLNPPRLPHGLRRQARVATQRTAVSPQFTADGARRAPECAGHGPHTRTALAHARNRHALLRLKLLVRSSALHLSTLPEARCCTSDLRPPPLRECPLCERCGNGSATGRSF